MALELDFHGAAGAVTGSCMELKAGDKRILVDCGLFQGSRSLEALNYEPLPFEPRRIDAVVLTHAHLDHSGRLGLLARQGFRGPIHCTPPTRHLLAPLLTDAARLQASDAERRNHRPDRIGRPAFEPLYDDHDVRQVFEQAEELRYGQWAEISPGIAIRFSDAHHILGAASVEVRAEGQHLLFSGDIGDGAATANGPPRPEGGWDHVICESTYGDRDRVRHTPEERRELLAAMVEPALARGGNLLIPAFALERTQIVLADLVALFASGRLRPSPVFVDSPLADRVTRTYRRFGGIQDSPSPFDSPHVRFTTSVPQSKALNRVTGAIILAGSGMCTGGRIRHHLVRNLPKGEATVLMVGYQARGSLGAVLESGARAVRISGNDVPVRARIEKLDVYSAHADHQALLQWLTRRAPVRGSIFLDHGEPPALERLATDAAAIAGLPHPIVPLLGERFRLDAGKPAQRIGKPRPDAPELIAREDWRNRYAAFAASLEERLRALPSDAARRHALEAAERAFEGQAGERAGKDQAQAL
ncbi:MBL fold metallo-hydrolase [Sphingomonas sp. LB-2]|uniref:MBL fold metallo-hydrolase n=1 Tax=Sphingomonas caeni TaxID=2984949 RepID=UPI00222F0FDB|nr:MBL fold metallo-hydrolase [Sphingomonas caeni]MCW3849607.1 MBL fold metallo-hydrolase [Sphingomonas caeni]